MLLSIYRPITGQKNEDSPANQAPEQLEVSTIEETPSPTIPEERFDVTGDYSPRLSGLVCYADSSCTEIADVLSDSTVHCIGEENGIYQIQLSSGKNVWIDGWYLVAVDPLLEAARYEYSLHIAESSPSYQAFEYIGDETYHSVTDDLNCRTAPSLDSDVYCTINSNSEVIVLGQQDGFYYCKLSNGGLAWCWGEYIVSGDTDSADVSNESMG